MLVFRAAIHKFLVRIVHREDPDQTASSEAVSSGSALIVTTFLHAANVRNFRTFSVPHFYLAVSQNNWSSKIFLLFDWRLKFLNIYCSGIYDNLKIIRTLFWHCLKYHRNLFGNKNHLVLYICNQSEI